MANYDEIFKHIVGEFPGPLAALALAADVDSEMQGTLLFGLSIFGSLVHPSEFFQDPLLEAIMQKSPFYEHVIQRGKAQGIEQGKAQGIEQGKAQGIEQGKAQGIEQGRAEVYRAWHADWEKRKQAAEEKGIPFDEPPPPKPE